MRNDVHGMHNILTLHVHMLFPMSLWPCNCSPAGIRAKKAKTAGDIQTGSEMRNDMHRMHNILTFHVYKTFLMLLWPCDCSPAGIRAKKGQKRVKKAKTAGDIQTASEMRNDMHRMHRMHNILTLHVYKLFLMSLWPCNCSPAGIRAKKGEKGENSWRHPNWFRNAKRRA
jgi:hypothetical protein